MTQIYLTMCPLQGVQESEPYLGTQISASEYIYRQIKELTFINGEPRLCEGMRILNWDSHHANYLTWKCNSARVTRCRLKATFAIEIRD
jgi:hypothetical protein